MAYNQDARYDNHYDRDQHDSTTKAVTRQSTTLTTIGYFSWHDVRERRGPGYVNRSCTGPEKVSIHRIVVCLPLAPDWHQDGQFTHHPPITVKDFLRSG